ncbi:hypothetical protein [Dermacoccus nishinomiyaensis]|uniref:hypothetical protein n=1 Tax=Dermacoccus nishinomiyaensis TaxID=1274 RepID=UPI0016435D91|nr:hypothetical protein [Dermacoccus nishinomiyaensis]
MVGREKVGVVRGETWEKSEGGVVGMRREREGRRKKRMELKKGWGRRWRRVGGWGG